MTRITAIVVAIAFIINDFTIFYSVRSLKLAVLVCSFPHSLFLSLFLKPGAVTRITVDGARWNILARKKSERFLDSKHLGSNLMYLISVTLLLRELEVFPVSLWERCFPACLVLEIPIAQTILEVSLIFLWRRLQEIVAANAELMLKRGLQDRGLEWIFCHLCCGEKSNCAAAFTGYFMKFLGFVMLVSVCVFIRAR